MRAAGTRDKKATNPLILRGGRWYASTTVRVGGHSLKLREASGFVEKDKPKAEAWLRRRVSEIETELLYGPPPERKPEKPTIVGFAKAAADYAERGGKNGALGKQDINKLLTLAEFFGERPVDRLGQDEWMDFVDSELDDPAPDTVRRWFVMFSAPIRRALRADGRAIAEFDLPPAGTGRAIYLEEDAAEELHACYAPHVQPIITMLKYQGCRIGEALRLHLPGDISFRRGTISFLQTKGRGRDGELRIVPMHEHVAADLRQYLGERNLGPLFLTQTGQPYTDRRMAARGEGRDGSGIRTAHRSALLRYTTRKVLASGSYCHHCDMMLVETPGRANSAQLLLVRARNSGGTDDIHNYRAVCAACAARYPGDVPRMNWFRIHDWRHHWASWFIMKGGRETELMRLGGWKDARMVQRYVRLSVEHLRQAVNQL